jgi:hypothetical protein
MIPQKFALIFKRNVAYTGNASDRVGSFFLILLFGPIILTLNICVDTHYFVIHMYMKDLERIDDKTIKPADMSTKTYHKLYIYLESNPSPYMEYERVAVDIRKELNVVQGIAQMLYPHKAILKGTKEQRNASHIVNEYINVKHILLNNSIEVSTTRLFPHNVKKITKDLRFNKKVLQYNLLDMLRFRKLLLLKRRVFLFSVMYEGVNSANDKNIHKRKKQIERYIDDAFFYINTKRTLKAIGYKPKTKIISHEDNIGLDEGSEVDLVESMKNFHVNIAEKNFRKGGLLSRNTSKLSFRRGMTPDRLSKSRTGMTSMGIAEDFRVDKDSRRGDEEVEERLIGLGDDTENSEIELEEEKRLGAVEEEQPLNISNRSYDLRDSDNPDITTESLDEEESDEDVEEDSKIEPPSLAYSENIEFSKDTITRYPHAN